MPSGEGELSVRSGTSTTAPARAVTGPALLQYLLGLCAACLPTVMSTKKKITPTKTPTLHTPTSARKRVRRETWPALASSSALTPAPAMAATPTPTTHEEEAHEPMEVDDCLALPINTRQRTARQRTTSVADYVSQFMASRSTTVARPSGRPSRHKDCFPFDRLPMDCKLKIFTFLTPCERGVSSQVCREWYKIMLTPSLWNVIDLTSFPLCQNSSIHKCGPSCYEIYKRRLKQFMGHLQFIRPAMKRFSFAFDIIDAKDGWIKSLEALLGCSYITELEYAHLNWRETPIKALWMEEFSCSPEDFANNNNRHRRRQRMFCNFLDQFTRMAPNLSQLVMPFDWSNASLMALSRLQNLDSLVLEKYFVLQQLSQGSLDQLFVCAPNLERLILEVWTPSARGMQLYTMQSPVLRYLDVSQCRGFYLQQMDCPAMTVFKVARHPWNGPLTCVDDIHIPCIYDVLVNGTPNLCQINEHTLQADWKSTVYPELETVLQAVCSCRKHKSGWHMC